MRTPVLATAAVAGLLALALPSSAAELAPCDPVEGATTVRLADPSTTTFAAPSVPGVAADTVAIADEGTADELRQSGSSTVFRFVLDASGSSVADATRAAGNVTLTWGDDSDFDMFVYDASGSEVGSGTTFNPQTGGGETASSGVQKHCSVFSVEVRNYLGAPGEMTLGVKVAGHRK